MTAPTEGFFASPGCVAVTGHRLDRLPDPMPERLMAACRDLYGVPHRECNLLSCLADGTDLIAAAAWPADRLLETLLPVPVALWHSHVQPSEAARQLRAALARSRPEILAPAGPPDFVALADRLVSRCDRLFAVWDGRPGKPGGTGSVVARARALGKPVLHLPLASLSD